MRLLEGAWSQPLLVRSIGVDDSGIFIGVSIRNQDGAEMRGGYCVERILCGSPEFL